MGLIILFWTTLNSNAQDFEPLEVDTARELDQFIENWDSASFSYQEWDVECDHWKIDEDNGQPPPSAKNAGKTLTKPIPLHNQ
ncbi:MAG: hypothetical protein K9G67_00910 [Bacteroidales bacterium]|nr:hypothetical protein [Bacteroidales bacterium]MCF8343728.1 hypothetical protein [Bacteroidales bacterium]MCF8349646.1 hypothetical protein [Bacteroidales bacterium]MCF8374892.1 hypothetical protein [Bacteroidales bacterium]MCF8400129.1 hypothetical protein [Bacteroidales bacterium]